jgi:hypothetical protein
MISVEIEVLRREIRNLRDDLREYRNTDPDSSDDDPKAKMIDSLIKERMVKLQYLTT